MSGQRPLDDEAMSSDIAVNATGGYEMRGPLCSDGLHTFVVALSPVGISPKKVTLWTELKDIGSELKEGNTAAQGVFTGLGVVLTAIPFVGWLLAFPFLLLGLYFGKRAERNRIAAAPAEQRRIAAERTKELESLADVPWRWALTREGPEPWRQVIVDDYQYALSLGIHHPWRAVSDRWWLVAQTEKSLPQAVEMAERMLREFTY